VVDAAGPERDSHVEAVERILAGLDLSHKPRLLVWNKVDQLNPDEVASLLRARGGVAISAARKLGLEQLLRQADRTLFAAGVSDELPLSAQTANGSANLGP
jgi:GTP-binding protein HflX